MTSVALDYETLTDIELAKLIAQRDSLAVRVVTRRNNQRLYRTAWSVLKDRPDAEEAVQEGYLKGFAAIDIFCWSVVSEYMADPHRVERGPWQAPIGPTQNPPVARTLHRLAR